MMLLDGKALAQKILAELKEEIAMLKNRLRLAVVVVGEDPAVRIFINEKKKAAEGIGIDVRVYPFDAAITTNELRKRIAEIVHEKKNTGVIVQLPLPPQINKQYILNAITPEKDADVLSSRAVGDFAVGKSPIIPPVAGAVKALFEEYGVDYKKKSIVILGAGSLVGKPLAFWFFNERCGFTVIAENAEAHRDQIRAADIIVSGAGSPGLVSGEMVKEGVVVIDAGTSESEGKLVGDIDFDSVAAKASYIAPVPGGVGPLTVAVLMRNVVILGRKN